MNHQLIYEKIIKKAKSEFRIKHNGIYYEEHHIIPRCLGGNNENNNLILLTAREHFICHKLLMFVYHNNRDINYAFIRMAMDKKHNRKVSSHDYEYAKQLFIPWNKGKTNCYSENTKLKWSEIRKGRKCLNKESFCAKGRKHSEKTKNVLRENHLGEKNPMFGKPAWKAINNIRKICEYCGCETNIGNYGRWHGKNCKFNI